MGHRWVLDGSALGGQQAFGWGGRVTGTHIFFVIWQAGLGPFTWWRLGSKETVDVSVRDAFHSSKPG